MVRVNRQHRWRMVLAGALLVLAPAALAQDVTLPVDRFEAMRIVGFWIGSSLAEVEAQAATFDFIELERTKVVFRVADYKLGAPDQDVEGVAVSYRAESLRNPNDPRSAAGLIVRFTPRSNVFELEYVTPILSVPKDQEQFNREWLDRVFATLTLPADVRDEGPPYRFVTVRPGGAPPLAGWRLDLGADRLTLTSHNQAALDLP